MAKKKSNKSETIAKRHNLPIGYCVDMDNCSTTLYNYREIDYTKPDGKKIMRVLMTWPKSVRKFIWEHHGSGLAFPRQ